MADADGTAVPPRKNADLGTRAISAAVMLAIVGAALIADGVWLNALVLAVALATLVELVLLVVKATDTIAFRLAAILAGIVYVGVAGLAMAGMHPALFVVVLGSVVMVDSFAYLFGRTLGGPKIAPSISPSKTWAGLLGGIVGASLWLGLVAFGHRTLVSLFPGNATLSDSYFKLPDGWNAFALILAGGAIVAVLAQAGDFLESWLKRKAGVKDSSNLIPGHGGVFDRTDGLVPVVLLFAAVTGGVAS